MLRMFRNKNYILGGQFDTLQLNVIQPFMLPYNSIGFVRKFNKRSVVRTVRKQLDKLYVKKPIVVSTVPNACDYIGFFDEIKVIYYCVDDFAQWPGHNKFLVRDMENQLVEN